MSGISAGGFDPAADITFTGTTSFSQPALIEGAVVQIKRQHAKTSAASGTNNTAGTTDEYVNLSRSPTNFFVEITPYSVNSDLRVSVVASVSYNNGGQYSYWVAGRLYRNDADIADCINDRAQNIGTNADARRRGTGWICSTAGQSVTNNFQSNFVRQLSGIYLDENPTQVLGKVKYSLAIRQSTFSNAPFVNEIQLNEGYIAPGTNRPAGTSYIQVEEIYHAPT